MSENDKSGHLGSLTLFNMVCFAQDCVILHLVYRVSLPSKFQIIPGSGIDALGIK